MIIDAKAFIEKTGARYPNVFQSYMEYVSKETKDLSIKKQAYKNLINLFKQQKERDMKTLKEKIEIMTHFSNGGEIEFFQKFLPENGWRMSIAPEWDWNSCDYRILEKNKTITMETWLIKRLSDGEYYEIVTSDINIREQYSDVIRVKLLGSEDIDI